MNQSLYRINKARKIVVRKFCIDIPSDKEDYEKLLMEQVEGKVKFLGPPEKYPSPRDGMYYIYVEWSEVQ